MPQQMTYVYENIQAGPMQVGLKLMHTKSRWAPKAIPEPLGG